MKWNVDFEIASIVFQLVFLCFFFVKNHLPTRQNRLYISTVCVSFVTLILDVVTAYTNSYPGLFSRAVLMVANIAYFCGSILLSVLFFTYILALINRFAFVQTTLFAVFMLPAVAAILVTLSTPVTGFIFSIDSDMNYAHGMCYFMVLVAQIFYVLLALIFLFVLKSRLNRLEWRSICLCCIPLVAGGLLQVFVFPGILISNAMSILTLIAIYLSLENPDMYIDKSSGMYNGDAFRAMTSEYMAEGRPFSCVFLSIADYKNLDAVYGSENMQAVTTEVIKYLRDVFTVRGLYRLKPWTFVIQEVGRGDFEEVARALQGRFEKPFMGVTDSITIEPEIAVIPYWNMPRDVAGIDALYNFIRGVRGSMRGEVLEADDRLIAKMEHERNVEHAIENAIATGSIQIYYQPIYSADTGRINSCEALSRLFDENIGFISPDEFIKKAEETGSIGNLGLQIFEKVCAFMNESKPWQYGIDHIHVNLSPVQFKQESLAGELIDITSKYEIERKRIVLEITETAAVEESLVIHGNMDRLIAAGFTFSLDDYGTGFSNTASIIRLPFSSVKIDKSLLWAYFNRQSNILPDLINMFINQKLELIAEGVETREMVDTLADMKCMNMQGFYFSKPLPMREFMSFVWEFNRRAIDGAM